MANAHAAPTLIGCPRTWTAGFPAWVHDARGAELILRETRPEDADAIRDLHARCSEGSLRWRYFSSTSQVERVLEWMFDSRKGRSVGVRAHGRLVGVAQLVRTDTPGVAEVAFLVEDEWQNRGIGSMLVDLLTKLAEDAGYARVRADVATDNDRMRHILLARGWSARFNDGIHELELDLD
jgi:RimJ/RimL family protein N-acetyltransferase